MEVTRSGHSTYKLQYHVVWVCKYRRRILNRGVESYLRSVLPKLLKNIPGVQIETIGFDQDHLHMVMTIPPRHSIASVMGKLKGQSASLLRQKFDFLEKVYWKENIVWSAGYFVSSVGLDEQTVKNYVLNQGQSDSGQIRMDL